MVPAAAATAVSLTLLVVQTVTDQPRLTVITVAAAIGAAVACLTHIVACRTDGIRHQIDHQIDHRIARVETALRIDPDHAALREMTPRHPSLRNLRKVD